jgi:hypothetical protein
MPTNRQRISRTPLGATKNLTMNQKLALWDGWENLLGEDIFTDEQAKAAWQANRQELLHTYIKFCPGSRPIAWWTFEHPEARLKLLGHSLYKRLNEKYCLEPEFESRYEWLNRNSFLLPDENPPDNFFVEIALRDQRIKECKKRLKEIDTSEIDQNHKTYHWRRIDNDGLPWELSYRQAKSMFLSMRGE